MRLAIASRPPIVLEGADLLEVSGWQLAAGGESPTLTVSLDPARVQAATLLDPPPLRAAAVLSEGADALFTGIVQAVRLGSDPSITLES